MKEYIERTEELILAVNAGARAIENTKRYHGTTYCIDVFAPREIPYLKAAEVLRSVDEIPAADVVERKRGEWEDEYGGAFANPRYRCSVCKEKALYRHEQDCLGGWHEVQALTDFCPNCGAEMRSHHDSLCDQTEEGEA